MIVAEISADIGSFIAVSSTNGPRKPLLVSESGEKGPLLFSCSRSIEGKRIASQWLRGQLQTVFISYLGVGGQHSHQQQ
jgi:hypothetical protein